MRAFSSSSGTKTEEGHLKPPTASHEIPKKRKKVKTAAGLGEEAIKDESSGSAKATADAATAGEKDIERFKEANQKSNRKFRRLL